MRESITDHELGNINTLKRDNGNANPYYYNGNKLSYVENFTNAFTCDGNGNATVDGKTSLNFEYNYLNLPTRVSNSTGGTVVNYIYDATGKRLTKTSSCSR